MPSFRIGFGSDFTLKNQRVGVGTADPRATLDVVGTLKGDLNITGVTTLTSYAGFVPQKQSGDDDVITTEVNTISEDIIVSVGKVFTVSAGATANIGVLENVSIGTHFSVPNGGTSLRPEEPIEGLVRFNNDLNTLEFYNGVEWRQFTVTGASGRGVFGGGVNPSPLTFTGIIDYVNISSLGNAQNFGDLTQSRRSAGSCSSSIRGVWAGGYTIPSPGSPAVRFSTVDYITIASQGNAIEFGDGLDVARDGVGGCSSSTRGLFAGGGDPSLKSEIDYIQISTLGTVFNFGSLSQARRFLYACASPTRGIFGAGITPVFGNTIDFVTISSTGNATDFGDLSRSRRDAASFSSGTRGVFGGGESETPSPIKTNTIDYITISSTGNAIDFGELTLARRAPAGCSTNIRGVFAGGDTGTNPYSNTIDFITIATIGNAQDFGDLTFTRGLHSGCSDSHGGLGGF